MVGIPTRKKHRAQNDLPRDAGERRSEEKKRRQVLVLSFLLVVWSVYTLGTPKSSPHLLLFFL